MAAGSAAAGADAGCLGPGIRRELSWTRRMTAPSPAARYSLAASRWRHALACVWSRPKGSSPKDCPAIDRIRTPAVSERTSQLLDPCKVSF
eukprot:507603-Amorphochlora_amoeboformis.AAC.1